MTDVKWIVKDCDYHGKICTCFWFNEICIHIPRSAIKQIEEDKVQSLVTDIERYMKQFRKSSDALHAIAERIEYEKSKVPGPTNRPMMECKVCGYQRTIPGVCPSGDLAYVRCPNHTPTKGTLRVGEWRRL